MELLELTNTQIQIIRDICKAAQDSFIRLHSGNSIYSPRLSLILKKLNLTEEEFITYSSDAFYDFQRVLENPTILNQMSKGFTGDFIKYAEYLREKLYIQYGSEIDELIEELQGLHVLKLTPINFN